MIPGKVYEHEWIDNFRVVVLATRRINECWCDYLVLCSKDDDPSLGLNVEMEDWHVRQFYRELTL